MANWQTDARRAAAKYGLGEWFVRQMGLEAHGQDLTSPAGAQGPAQIMPATARAWGLSPAQVHDRMASYDAAAQHMARYVRQFGSVSDALVAYNAGPGAVGRSLPNETKNYLRTILGNAGTGSRRPVAAPSHGEAGSLVSSLGAPPSSGGVSDPGQSGDFAGLVQSLLAQSRPQPVQSMGLPAPSFAAGPSLPQGFTALPTSSVPARPAQDRVQAALGLVGALGGVSATSGSGQAVGGPQTGSSAPTGAVMPAAPKMGRVKGAKAGVPVAHLTSEGGLHPTEGLAGFPAHDYFAPSGSAAVAPVSGRVVRLSGHDPRLGPIEGPHGPLGWSVYIQGSDGRTYYLTHLGSRDVKPGQRVRQGQVIGTVADYAKYGTPSHVHMGVSS